MIQEVYPTVSPSPNNQSPTPSVKGYTVKTKMATGLDVTETSPMLEVKTGGVETGEVGTGEDVRRRREE